MTSHGAGSGTETERENIQVTICIFSVHLPFLVLLEKISAGMLRRAYGLNNDRAKLAQNILGYGIYR